MRVGTAAIYPRAVPSVSLGAIPLTCFGPTHRVWSHAATLSGSAMRLSVIHPSLPIDRRSRALRVALGATIATLLFLGATAVASATQEYTISGTVAAQNGIQLGLAGTQVIVRDSTSGEQVAGTTTALEGSYSVSVPEGTYDVVFTPPLGSGYEAFTAHDEVITGNKVLDVVLVPAGLVEFSGVLRDPLGAPVVGAKVTLNGNGTGVSTVTDASGAFALNVSPGSYTLEISGARQGSEQVPNSFGLSQSINLTASREQDLTIPSIVVDVSAVGPTGEPVLGAQIEAGGGIEPVPLYPEDTPGAGGDISAQGTTDATGHTQLIILAQTHNTTPFFATPPPESELGHTLVYMPPSTTNTTLIIVFQSNKTTSGNITITSSLNPSVFGAKVSLTATVAPSPGGPTPTGTVTFKEGNSDLSVVTLKRGSAKYTLSTLGVGGHTITVAYSGDSHNEPGESAGFTQTVNRAATQVTLTSSANPAVFGSGATIKAAVKAVAPGRGTPTGTVIFSEGANELASVAVVGGSAKYRVSGLDVGQHAIKATYTGSSDFTASEPATLLQTIVPAASRLTLTSSANPARSGSAAYVKAVVKAVAPGSGTPTGTVAFNEGPNTLAVVPLSEGSAKLPIGGLPVGEHTITVSYGGDLDFAAAEPVSIVQTIKP